MVDIAQDWKFSEEFQTAIQDQTLTDRSSLLGDLLYIANHLCEVYLLAKLDCMSHEYAGNILAAISTPEDSFT